MKAIKYIIALVIVSLIFGCIRQGNPDEKTRKINEAYYGWDEVMSRFLTDYANVAFHFNHWLTVSEHEKDSLEDRYFSNYKIRQESEKSWLLLNMGTQVYRIEIEEGDNLNDVGTAWRVTVNNNLAETVREFYQSYDFSYYVPYDPLFFSLTETSFSITHNTLGNWIIRSSTGNGSSLNLMLKNYGSNRCTDIFEDELHIQGGGNLKFSSSHLETEEVVTLAFNIETALLPKQYVRLNSQNRLNWAGGKFNLAASSANANWMAVLRMRDSNDDEYFLEIHYKDIVEVWNYPTAYAPMPE
ncbi:MAG: hypothetical protein LBV02_08520 [Bacteroidales bacterium]|jgi:hypothetical protein|nr:hypothetical protein [Bacteroidales bacterium]